MISGRSQNSDGNVKYGKIAINDQKKAEVTEVSRRIFSRWKRV